MSSAKRLKDTPLSTPASREPLCENSLRELAERTGETFKMKDPGRCPEDRNVTNLPQNQAAKIKSELLLNICF